jgi:hypothetical protein
MRKLVCSKTIPCNAPLEEVADRRSARVLSSRVDEDGLVGDVLHRFVDLVRIHVGVERLDDVNGVFGRGLAAAAGGRTEAEGDDRHRQQRERSLTS